MLMIAYNIDSSQAYKHETTKKVKVNDWINLKISQIGGVYETKVDYKLVYNKTSSVPKTELAKWTKVDLVTGNSDRDTNKTESGSTIVWYRNLKINTCKTSGK